MDTPGVAVMADHMHPTAAGPGLSAFTRNHRNPEVPRTPVQQHVANMTQRTTGVMPTKRKRGRPRKPKVDKPKRFVVSEAHRKLIFEWRKEGRANKDIAALLKLKYETVRQIGNRLLKEANEPGGPKPSARKKQRTSKYTDDMKITIAAMVLLEPSLTLRRLSKLAGREWPDVGFSIPSIKKILDQAELSLKVMTTRKRSWNSPSTLIARKGYPDFLSHAGSRYQILYYDEQNYNVLMRRSRGRALPGVTPVAEVPDRTSGGGATSLHLVVSAEHGLVHAMVVSKDADQVTTRQFVEGLVDTLARLDEQRHRGDERPWLVIMDNDKQHHTRHVSEYFEDANLSSCFLPAYSPFLNPIEYIFSLLRMELDNMGGFHYTTFTENRTAAQLQSLTRKVMLAVKKVVTPQRVDAFEKRCGEYHPACRHGMPIYDGSRAPSGADIEAWEASTEATRVRALTADDGEAFFADGIAEAYRSRMGIPILPETDPHLARAAAALSRWQKDLEKEAAALPVTVNADVRPGTQAWYNSIPLSALRAHITKKGYHFKTKAVVTYQARVQAAHDSVVRQKDLKIEELQAEVWSKYAFSGGLSRKWVCSN